MNQHHSLKSGTFYHVYNRGINGENIFIEERNYAYFLNKYAIYLGDVLDTYAYCLLKNHFHLLIRVKDNLDLPGNLDLTGFKNLSGLRQSGLRSEKGLHHVDNIVSKKFRIYLTPTQKVLIKRITELVVYLKHLLEE